MQGLDLALQTVMVKILQHILQAVFHQGQRFFDQLLKRFSAMLADILIRVLAIRHHDNPHGCSGALHNGQCPDGRLLPGIIAVIAKVYRGSIPQ